MKKVMIVSGIALLGLAGAASATTCAGKWNGRVDTSVEFKQGGKAKYCYARDCWTQRMFKNGNDYLFLVGGNSAASVEMKASGKGFNATWRSGHNSAKAKLTCK
ncbi:hypothetical protein [Marimonas arenosa]|uniref:Uncharacterized protein n=1 Tax=Marimonas arenosa TaxID=1795305 RepID=A0AAE3WEP5_9RHOB|nr:hypothetical protein [Marimonas arenosa]MDQ2091347.1 hypothetical protein [Marimonas arenosa]